MKKAITVLALVLTAIVLLTSCAPSLVPIGDGFYDEKSKTHYVYAPMCYEAVGWKTEPHIKDDVGFEYHIILDDKGNEADSSLFLYDKTNKTLIYNKENTLPTLEELDPVEMYFAVEGNVSTTLTTENDKEKINAVVDICLNAPVCKYPALETDEYYRLKFYSSEHPYILYSVAYLEYDYDYCEYEKIADPTNHKFREGVTYSVTQENDGSYTVEYNYGKYFVYNRDTGECRMAKYIHDNYNSIES